MLATYSIGGQQQVARAVDVAQGRPVLAGRLAFGLFLLAWVAAWPPGAQAWDDERWTRAGPGHGHPRKVIILRRVVEVPPPTVSKVIIIDRRPIFFHHPRPVIIIPSPLMSTSTPPPADQPLALPPSYVAPPPEPQPLAPPPSSVAPPPSAQSFAYLRLDIQPDDTEVYLDSRLLGTAGSLKGASLLAIAPGKHLLEFRRFGSTVTRELDVPSGTTMIVLQDGVK